MQEVTSYSFSLAEDGQFVGRGDCCSATRALRPYIGGLVLGGGTMSKCRSVGVTYPRYWVGYTGLAADHPDIPVDFRRRAQFRSGSLPAVDISGGQGRVMGFKRELVSQRRR
eukprot:GHVU01104153.1.p1 GENE.GHVU01104153.1~~GHVU01104153.1.p1  ORF type:complete len:112 (-),score=0.53 GHVU01104153.1:154-489(-)